MAVPRRPVNQKTPPLPNLQRAADKEKKTAFWDSTEMALKAKFLKAFEIVLEAEDSWL